jgi:hypothetical protein
MRGCTAAPAAGPLGCDDAEVRLYAGVAEQYAEFAGSARGESRCFEEWALGVAADGELISLIGSLPPVKQQPNLVFAAARWNGVPAPAPYAELRRGLLGRWEAVRATVLTRSTQTNEVGRLATLVPAFAEIEERRGRPLALLEVGASAGLCLLPDRYGYRWRTANGLVSVPPPGDRPAPVLDCEVTGPAPLPGRQPEVGWRAGIDLAPVDLHDEDAVAWLENLVWPEQEERRSRLAAAVAVARLDPPPVVEGDLLTTLPALLEEVPEDLTAVVFHSAVVAYLEPADRERFATSMTGLVGDGRCSWVSNEAPEVLPGVTASAPPVPGDRPVFVLGVNGRAHAWTHGHGASLTWLTG